MSSPLNAQRGAALIVTLVMLLIMTLLGLSSMDATIMGERMAGHQKNKQASFDAAEAALRAGEGIAESLGQAPNPGAALYDQALDGDPAVWKDPATNWAEWVGAALPDVIQQPEYVIEIVGIVPNSRNCAVTHLPVGCERPARRVTARGWGNNANAMSIIQSVFLYIDEDG
ncbi:MAG: hypothetical protein EXR86_07085 [Gammaproteobacteria bacterium]|nr:hypothetical protein [Gammaproteobacteria bacterium]